MRADCGADDGGEMDLLSSSDGGVNVEAVMPGRVRGFEVKTDWPPPAAAPPAGNNLIRKHILLLGEK